MAKRRILNAIIVLFGSLLAFAGAWKATYPDEYDAKNPRYILWKHGLFSMDLDLAADIMMIDPDSKKLVIGQTEEQLRKRFSYLLTPDKANSYLQRCIADTPPPPGYPYYGPPEWKGKKLLLIRKSAWLVAFEGDKATGMWVLKGC
jgi:hypothetical protein